MQILLVNISSILGATLYKGLNRGLGTLCAGSLAFFVEFIADKSGQVVHAVFIGFSVFIIGSSNLQFNMFSSN